MSKIPYPTTEQILQAVDKAYDTPHSDGVIRVLCYTFNHEDSLLDEMQEWCITKEDDNEYLLYARDLISNGDGESVHDRDRLVKALEAMMKLYDTILISGE